MKRTRSGGRLAAGVVGDEQMDEGSAFEHRRSGSGNTSGNGSWRSEMSADEMDVDDLREAGTSKAQAGAGGESQKFGQLVNH
jgi:hypothetical protein